MEKENNTHFLRVDGVKQPVAFYSLDVIISIGYRVKSQRGTQFRIWANKILKDYLVKGYVVNKTLTEYNPQIQISVVSGTKRSIFRQKNKTKRSKKRLHTTLIKPEQKVNEDLCSDFIVS